MIKYLMGILFCLFVSMSATAQLFDINKQKKDDINKVKKSSMYLYGEATLSSVEEASKLAEELLYSEIDKWISSKKELREAKNVIVKNVSKSRETITLPRGNMFRAFLYVKKQDILPSDNVNVLKQDKKSADAVVVETIGKQEVAEEKFDSSFAEKKEEDFPEFLNRVVALEKFQDIQTCLVGLKKEGKISFYPKYADLVKPEDYYLIIYNKAAQVVAVLGPGKESRMNLKTRKADSITNYKGCGAIGFK